MSGEWEGAVAFEQNHEPRSTFMSDIQSVRSNGGAVFSWDANYYRNTNYQVAANMADVHA